MAGFFVTHANLKLMILPIVFLLASLAFSAPTPLSATSTDIVDSPETLGGYVRQYFADKPILADIAWCESRMRHLDETGKIFRGKVNHNDIGVMQINTNYHEDTAKEIGLDLYSLSGNLAYAEYLYDKEGTKPWASSQACWDRLSKK